MSWHIELVRELPCDDGIWIWIRIWVGKKANPRN